MTDRTHDTPPKQYGLKAVLRVGVVLLILGALLLADLAFQGLAWRTFYALTGEEGIAGQIQGMVELGGNLIRPQPVTEPLTPVNHTDLFPYSVNTFFEQETEVDKKHEQLRMIQAAGFGAVRQEFPWEDLEVDGRGQFTDSRIDYDGDGQPDTINAWDKYDRIVDMVESYDLRLLVRLSNPPDWSRAETPDTLAGPLGPPDDLQDFVNYAVAVAERYRGRIYHYQVWNEPNIYPEWGEAFVDPARYTEMLCRTYDALKAVDPEIVVISGTLAPTASLDGYGGYQDLVFLQNMYDNGAAACFDVLSAQGYGLNSGPTDRRFRATYLNFARHVLYRDLMVANGDAHKAIWLSEVAWNPVLDAFLPPEEIAGAFNFGAVTNEQAARYLQGAYQRARQDWPWIGQISYWHFTRPTIEEADQAFYWFRMVEADYPPTFTPLPVYHAAQDYIADTIQQPTLYRGVHQAQSWEITAENSTIISDADAEFGTAVESQRIFFMAEGTRVALRLKNDAPVRVVMDGTFDILTIPASQTWQTVTLRRIFLPQAHSFNLETEGELLLDSVLIDNALWRNLAPIILGVVVLLLALPAWLIWRRRHAA